MIDFLRRLYRWLWPPFPEGDDLDVLTYPKERSSRGDAASEPVTIDVWSAPAPSSSDADMKAGKDETDPHAGRDFTAAQEDTAPETDPHIGRDFAAAQSDAAPETDPHAGRDFTVVQKDTAPETDPHAGRDFTAVQKDTAPETDLLTGQDQASATVEIVTVRRGTDPADMPDLPDNFGASEKLFSNGGWIAFGRVEGVEVKCCINPRASWQRFLMGDMSTVYNVRDGTWRGPDRLNHLRPAIVEWIQAEYAESRKK